MVFKSYVKWCYYGELSSKISMLAEFWLEYSIFSDKITSGLTFLNRETSFIVQRLSLYVFRCTSYFSIG